MTSNCRQERRQRSQAVKYSSRENSRWTEEAWLRATSTPRGNRLEGRQVRQAPWRFVVCPSPVNLQNLLHLAARVRGLLSIPRGKRDQGASETAERPFKGTRAQGHKKRQDKTKHKPGKHVRCGVCNDSSPRTKRRRTIETRNDAAIVG
jgi:hypothetical protein